MEPPRSAPSPPPALSSPPTSSSLPPPVRVIGLDIHKRYLVAAGIDPTTKQVVCGPKRVESSHIAAWAVRELHPTDAVVLEMTTHTWQMVDLLTPHVQSVTVVHPPHVHMTMVQLAFIQRYLRILAPAP